MKTENSKYHQNPGFSVPENYFSELHSRVMENLDDDRALPGHDHGFTVPGDYFENLNQRILDNVDRPEPKVIPFYRKRIWTYAAAVAVIALLLFANLFKTRPVDSVSWDDIEVSVMEDYIDEGYDMGIIDLDSDDYSEFIFNDGKLVDDADFQNVNSEAVYDYLEDNLDNPADILE